MIDPIEDPTGHERMSRVLFFLAWAAVGMFIVVGVGAVVSALI